MIRALPKPLPDYSIKRRDRQLPNRNRMTLAIGMKCKEGIFLAADTRFSYDDGSKQEAVKIFECPSPSGQYIVVHSSEDAFAAESLINEIRRKLDGNAPDTDLSSLRGFEDAVKDTLRKWYVYEHEDRPRMHLLMVASLNAQEHPALYFCEPPNTVTPVTGNYRAIGDGWPISDRIYQWFESNEPKPLHECLCQLSYIMYKTKEVIPKSVGGDTDVMLLGASREGPLWIERQSMASAEKTLGLMFDRNLGKIVALVMSGDAGGPQTMLHMGHTLYQSSLNYAGAEFRCRNSKRIIIREFCT